MQNDLLDEVDTPLEQLEILTEEKEKTRLSRRMRDKNINKVIGHNLKTARKVANKTTKEVMRAVWGADPSSSNLNRISEIENGLMTPSPSVLVELAQLYGCSLDYIYGISPEFESDLAAGNTGLIINAMRETCLDMADSLSSSLVRLAGNMPPLVGQQLLDASKKCVHEFQRCRHDLVFTTHYKQFFEAFGELEAQTIMFDKHIARKLRLIDVTFESALDRAEESQRLIMERKKAPMPQSIDTIDS
ncbi:helix-turn-helix domain-containing protein [Acinetobacter colistiniresistens]|uniref:helix-turn-helix domain-containing protein n=1 Tax=Acinetobacter colistiniresistens TaxID=280145 RepID=UPI001250C35E|nr:helix-turn-helix domain-containing protein [Acinetobacter colistiniresistens]